jgi:hypothetical protein
MEAIRAGLALTALAAITAAAGAVWAVAHTVSHLTRPRERAR